SRANFSLRIALSDIALARIDARHPQSRQSGAPGARAPRPDAVRLHGGRRRRRVDARREPHGWSRIQLLPRMLRGVAERSLATTVLGAPISFPVIVPPMAFQGMCHPDAEAATARATAGEGTIFCASTVSNCSLEAIAAASNGPRWFQLYVYRDKSVTRELVDRAVAAGYGALCLTVDTPLAGPRERDRRNSLRMPAHLQLGNFPASHSKEHHEGATGVSALAHYIAAQWDAGLTWADVDWLRSISP